MTSHNDSNHNNNNNNSTGVDGQGMWRSWTRVFSKPTSAALDLLDNCFDATTTTTTTSSTTTTTKTTTNAKQFRGKVVLTSHGTTTVSLANTSVRPLKSLRDALTVYKSSKNASQQNTTTTTNTNTNTNTNNFHHHKDAIGENGVGLKQGCATLSDCSLVLTKNHHDRLEMGILAKSLQTTTGVYLPSFAFHVKVSTTPLEEEQPPDGNGTFTTTTTTTRTNIPELIQQWWTQHDAIAAALTQAWGHNNNSNDDDAAYARDQVVQFANRLWTDDPWKEEPHVFLLVLCHVKRNHHGTVPPPHALMQSVHVAPTFLQDLKHMLPEYYINLPTTTTTTQQQQREDEHGLDFVIDGQRIDFTHWPLRLVELTKFQVMIPVQQDFATLDAATWEHQQFSQNNNNNNSVDDDATKYPCSIYCGFDAQRVDADCRLGRGTSTCHLYIYSTAAGRLIQKQVDARYMLGLGASGVDFTQGLTVIINDVAGKLPLTPTKDGIAWSERRHGEIHQRNLIAWAGAVAHFFWNYHKNQFGSKGKVKELLKKTIQSFAQDQLLFEQQLRQQQQQQQQATMPVVSANMEDAKFVQFHDIKWKRVQPNYDNRWKIRKANQPHKSGNAPDTLFVIDSNRIRRIKGGNLLKRPTTMALGAPGPRGEEAPNKRIRRTIEATHGGISPEPVYTWAEVAQNDIPRVTLGVLSFLRIKDNDNVFEYPVLETLPNIKEAYLKVVSQPMDFQTIEKERVHSYKSISELRNDLILTFENCIKFNGETSPYGKFAEQMLDRLDDAFESTDIKQITLRVLAHLREIDERELFELPVIEQVPNLKEEYLAVVPVPMDFQTIEEERMHSYTTVSDLQKDLELIFQNCIRFNGESSSYGHVARQMLKILNDTLESIVMGKRIRKKTIRYVEKVNVRDDENDKVSYKSGGKKKSPYNALLQELLETKKQLEKEKAKVKALRSGLLASQRRVRELEGKPLSPVGSSAQPGQNHVSASDIESGCRICQKDDDFDNMLLCEGCDDEYHTYCVALSTVPEGDWYCTRCLELGLGTVTANASKDTESDDEMEQRATKEGQEKEDHDSDYESDLQPDTVGSILTL